MHQVLDEASVGGLFTYGDPFSNGHAGLGGLDFSYQNSRLPGGRVFAANVFVMGADSDRAGGSASAYGCDLDYPNEPVDLHFYFRSYDEKFLPTLGFLDRPGTREYSLSSAYIWRPNTAWLRRISLRAWNKFLLNFDGQVAYSEQYLPELILETPAGDAVEFEFDRFSDRLDAPFAIRPGNVLAPGEYSWLVFYPQLRTSPARPVSAALFSKIGDYYNGHRLDLGGSLTWRPSRHFAASGSYEHRDITLPTGHFEVHLATASLNVAFNPDLTWSTLAQYDNLSGNVGISSRLRWTFHPGHDLFIVWNDGGSYTDNHFVRLGSAITLKVGLTFRL